MSLPPPPIGSLDKYILYYPHSIIVVRIIVYMIRISDQYITGLYTVPTFGSSLAEGQHLQGAHVPSRTRPPPNWHGQTRGGTPQFEPSHIQSWKSFLSKSPARAGATFLPTSHICIWTPPRSLQKKVAHMSALPKKKKKWHPKGWARGRRCQRSSGTAAGPFFVNIIYDDFRIYKLFIIILIYFMIYLFHFIYDFLFFIWTYVRVRIWLRGNFCL